MRTEWFSAAQEPAVPAGSVASSKRHLVGGACLQADGPGSPGFFGVARMHKCEMGVPRGSGVDPQAQWMITREPEVVRAACIDEREPAAGIRVPGVGGDPVEGGAQLRGVDHGRQIYGARQSLGN